MLYDFQIGNEKVRLWRRVGESYEHVLMKAIGFAIFNGEYPSLEIEVKVGLRYKPDLVARTETGDFLFWGEAGANSLRKTAWILKHTRTEKLALFKIRQNINQLIEQLKAEIPEKYRPCGRLTLINFVADIADLTRDRQIEKVSKDWFTRVEI